MLILLYSAFALASEPSPLMGPVSLTEDSKTEDDSAAAKKKPEEAKPEAKPEVKPEAAPEPEKVETNTAPSANPHIIVGVETGAALNTTELKAAFLPVWHVGLQFPYWQERLGVIVHGSYHVSKLEATADAAMMTNGSYSYDIRQQEAVFGFNLRVRIPEVPVVTPEIWLGPTIELIGTELQGKSGEKFPVTTEQDTRLGVHSALLGAYPLPVGELFGGVHYNAFSYESTIQGTVWSQAFSPTVGYRYRFF